MVVRYRVEIYKIKNHVYKCELQASPCDLSEVKDLMFSQDEDGGNSFSDKILDIGGICAIAVEGDVKSPKKFCDLIFDCVVISSHNRLE